MEFSVRTGSRADEQGRTATTTRPTIGDHCHHKKPCPHCIIATRGYDFWERHGSVLFRRGLELVVEEDEILLVERLVAVEAGGKIGRGVRALVRLEGLVLPFAVADVVRVLGAPPRAPLPHPVAHEIALDET